MKAKELCALIRACGDAQVTELKFGDIHVIFKTDQKVSLIPADQKAEWTSGPQDSPTSAGHRDDQAVYPFAADEQSIKEDQIELMKIESPHEYERLHVAGEFEDGETAHY